VLHTAAAIVAVVDLVEEPRHPGEGGGENATNANGHECQTAGVPEHRTKLWPTRNVSCRNGSHSRVGPCPDGGEAFRPDSCAPLRSCPGSSVDPGAG